MIKEIEGKKYKLSDVKKLKVGDLWFMPFTMKVMEYKDVDYGIFDPKLIDGAYKIEIVNES